MLLKLSKERFFIYKRKILTPLFHGCREDWMRQHMVDTGLKCLPKFVSYMPSFSGHRLSVHSPSLPGQVPSSGQWMMTSPLFLERDINFSLGGATVLGGSIYSLACNLSAEINIFYLNIHLQIQSDLKEYSVTLGMVV